LLYGLRESPRGPQEWVYRGLVDHGVALSAALTERIRRLTDYMEDISRGDADDRLATVEMANKALRAWADLWKASGFTVPVPDAAPADDGHLVFAWKRDEHYFEMEVFPDGACELFYDNRATGELWSAEYRVGETPPSEALSKLGLFS